ncbi:MAG: hypothetical protein RLY14_2362 [Planctomycetota bacterium]
MLPSRQGIVAPSTNFRGEDIGSRLRSYGQSCGQGGSHNWLAFAASLLLVALNLTGCASLKLPAIDPNGQQIFLPSPNSTTLSSPKNCALFPTPAFQTPPTPPPCVQGLDPGCGGPATSSCYDKGHGHCTDQGERGQIMMTPLRVVAPVGGEVVLLAGICGEDGYLVTREPLEWMLSPDSVGQFIEVGDEAKGILASHSHLHEKFHGGKSVEKLGIDFARGRTSAKESMITRGSPSRTDDLIIKRGQTWISLTSPTPGTSYVTALAPESKIWDRRRVTSMVHWVQGQWQFPGAQSRADKESANLTTLVTISEGVPAPNWKVIYRSLSPQVALFSNGKDTAEVRSDADGNATVQLMQNNGAVGSAVVAIEVVSPADSRMNTPELVLGRGQTIVSWVAPKLSLFAQGPSEAAVDETLAYTFRIVNGGQMPAPAAEARLTLPTGMKFLDATVQPANFTPSGAVWSLGTLQPGQEVVISARVKAESESPYRVQFETRAEPDLYQVQTVSTNIFRPALEVDIRPTGNQTEVEIGKTILMEIDVRNISNRALTDVRVLVESDPGLIEVNERDNSVMQSIPVIAGGDTKPIGITFLVQRAGPLKTKVSVSSPQNAFASAEAVITGTQGPATGDQLSGGVFRNSENAVRGQEVVFSLELENRGQPLTAVRVYCDPDSSLQPTSLGGDGYDIRATESSQRMTWMLDRWETGERKIFVGRFQTLQAGKTSRLRYTLQSAEGMNQTYDGLIEVLPSDNSVAPPNNGGSTLPPDDNVMPPGNSALQIQLIESGDPINVNQETLYRLNLVNRTNVEDSNVDIQLKIPAAVEFVSISSTFGQLRIIERTADGIIRLEPIRSLRAGETLNLSLRVIPRQPAQLRLEAFAKSNREPTGVETSVETTALP